MKKLVTDMPEKNNDSQPNVAEVENKKVENKSDQRPTDMPPHIQVQKDATSDSPVYNFPHERVELPSKGLLYPKTNPLSKGYVEMKYMTAKEEDILSTDSYIRQNIVLDKLFESMIVSDINYEDLLVGDKNAIMIHSRILGYGPEYVSRLQSPSGDEVELSVDLSDIKYKEFDDSLITPHENRFTFTLPKSGDTVEFKLLTVRDQKKIDKYLSRLRKVMGKQASEKLTYRFKQIIISVNGETDRGVVNRYVDNMLVQDTRALRDYMIDVQPDVDLEVEAEDPSTGEPFLTDIEFGLDLFYPDYKG